MVQPFLGQITMMGCSFAPVGYAFCSGQTMAISGNDALFALIGTTYGGDGQSTFALPDLQGRIPVNQGTGPGLSTYVLGQKAGTESVTLTTAQLPVHQHLPVTNNTDPTADAPSAAVMPARPKQASGGNSAILYSDPTKTPAPSDMKAMLAGTIASTGSNIPHDNMSPFLAINFVIALEGIFPSRN
jgi:microcystin-dependent protein